MGKGPRTLPVTFDESASEKEKLLAVDVGLAGFPECLQSSRLCPGTQPSFTYFCAVTSAPERLR